MPEKRVICCLRQREISDFVGCEIDPLRGSVKYSAAAEYGSYLKNEHDIKLLRSFVKY